MVHTSSVVASIVVLRLLMASMFCLVDMSTGRCSARPALLSLSSALPSHSLSALRARARALLCVDFRCFDLRLFSADFDAPAVGTVLSTAEDLAAASA